MKNNYHTHMYLCRHATGNVEDYVQKAMALGFSSIGMSDHAPFEELKDRSVRMQPSELETYLDECEEAVRKYGSQIHVLKGIEIEFFPKHYPMYGKLLERLDYLALGQHYVDDPGNRNDLCSSYALNKQKLLLTYADTVAVGIATGLFRFVCHPDLMLYSWGSFDAIAAEASKKIISAAVQYGVALEINANGVRKGLRHFPEGERYLYPRQEFWQLVKTMGAKVIVSSDAHTPDQLWDEAVQDCYEFASALDLTVAEELSL
ncbi:MAG: histidinol-phosphatase [bacterium]